MHAQEKFPGDLFMYWFRARGTTYDKIFCCGACLILKEVNSAGRNLAANLWWGHKDRSLKLACTSSNACMELSSEERQKPQPPLLLNTPPTCIAIRLQFKDSLGVHKILVRKFGFTPPAPKKGPE